MKKFKGFLVNIGKVVFKKKNIKWFVLLLIVIVTFSYFMFRKKVDEYKIEKHDLYQYFMGFKMEYKGSIKLNKDDMKVTKITFGKDSVNLNSTPLYYKDEEKVLFPESMAVIKPKEGLQYRINYYSLIYKDLDYYSIKEGKKNIKITNSVIYDGKDLYFFAEDVVVSFGENRISLGPLSYISVDTFNHNVEVYNFAEDDCKVYENILDEVIIQNDNYKLNATLDIMYYNGKSRLLIKDISKLKVLS